MKVEWEPTDLRAGRRVWRELECIIGKSDGSFRDCLVTVTVLKSGRIMVHGNEEEVAKYMSENNYRPCKER